MMNKLFNNFGLKLVALAMGLAIWLHVKTEKTYSHEFKLPVEDILLSDSLVPTGDIPDSLLVTVTAKGKQLLRRKWRQAGVRINVTQLRPGRHNVNLSRNNTFLVDASQGVQLEDVIFPAQITLAIDKQGAVKLPVTPQVDAEADEGFAVARDIVVTPPRVTLHGPRSRLRSIKNIATVRKSLSGLRTPIELTLPLVPPPGYGYRVEPESVLVSISVVPVKTRIYERVPVVVFHSPPDSTVTVDPPAVRVELSGPPEDIDLLNVNALTVSIDYRRRTPS
ncbi:MAG: YbbR-like domain-containing protein, partial [Candidatus Zixiibacteriota bacterium]